jgi:redox-sensitive bicupin YhaK (pirin superfamily)
MSSTHSFKIRESLDRGYANHGWLSTYHSFSFADYYDPDFSGWSSLRVLNEDRVKPGRGFGAHPHSNYEIFSYVISGSLEHKDSIGNQEVIGQGGVQFTSGSGVRHSEYNHSSTESVHFLQLWVKPNKSDLDPNYQTVVFSDEEKLGKLCLIVCSKDHASKLAEGAKTPVIINQDVKVYASLLAKNEQVTYDLGEERCGYLHVCDTGGHLRLSDVRSGEEVVLKPGDGAFIKEGTQVQVIGSNDDDKRAEFLLLDLAKDTTRKW